MNIKDFFFSSGAAKRWFVLAIIIILILFVAERVWSYHKIESTQLYIAPDSMTILINDCERHYESPCRWYALPEQAGPDVFQAIQPYRSKP